MANDIEFIDSSDVVKRALNNAIQKALERCGTQAEGYAQDLAPADTGLLRSRISHKVDTAGKSVYIGTNVEYAPYVELGTGIHYKGGRQTPWVYKDEKGQWHKTRGQEAQPFLKPAVANHKQTYYNIFEDEMKNA